MFERWDSTSGEKKIMDLANDYHTENDEKISKSYSFFQISTFASSDEIFRSFFIFSLRSGEIFYPIIISGEKKL